MYKVFLSLGVKVTRIYVVWRVVVRGYRQLDMEQKRKAFTLLASEKRHGLHLGPNPSIKMGIPKINIEKIILIDVYYMNNIKNVN